MVRWLLPLYLAIGIAFVWTWSIPHRRDDGPFVPLWAWIATALVWPFALLVFASFVWRSLWRRSRP